jgi:hypothetical protein
VPTPATLRSLHAERPLRPDEALAMWDGVVPGSRIKHVEPLGDPTSFPRLLETQDKLIERFGPESVTVLATGPLALPFRAVLAQRNALDYLALDGRWAAAQGQRLLADAVREARCSQVDGRTRRLGILGTALGHSRSPRLHQQPFDRIDLPPEAPVGELLTALLPHYRGFAVTSPFKKRVAAEVLTELGAANTLIRSHDTWLAENSDVAGAEAVLEALGAPKAVTVLGDGGVTEALRVVAAQRGVELAVLTRATVPPVPVRGAVVWTWPPSVDAPASLRFVDARVAVVSYGAGGRAIAAEIARRGGAPVRLGPRWFIAQARRQRALWESAT